MIRESAYLWIGPIVAMIVAQVLKPILIMVRLRRWDWARMRQSGGMPSSHTALVTALVAELWLRKGGHQPVIGIAFLLALVVMYDAAGVRWQTGRHAAVLNRLLRDIQGRGSLFAAPTPATPAPDHAAHSPHAQDASTLNQGSVVEPERIDPKTIKSLRNWTVAKAPWWLVDWPILNEHVGHKPTEVLGGVVVGILVALYLH